MNSGFWVFSFIWLLLFLPSVVLYFQPPVPAQPDRYVAVARIKEGDANFRAPFSSSWQRVVVGSQFAAGTVVSTKPKSRLILETNDGHILSVGSNSQIVLSDLRRKNNDKTLVFVLNGALSVKVEKQDSEPKINEPQASRSINRLSEVFKKSIVRVVSNSEKKIEVAVAGIKLDLTNSQQPIAISSVGEKLNILSNEPKITNQINVIKKEGPSDSKAVVMNVVDVKTLPNVEMDRQTFEELKALASESENLNLTITPPPFKLQSVKSNERNKGQATSNLDKVEDQNASAVPNIVAREQDARFFIPSLEVASSSIVPDQSLSQQNFADFSQQPLNQMLDSTNVGIGDFKSSAQTGVEINTGFSSDVNKVRQSEPLNGGQVGSNERKAKNFAPSDSNRVALIDRKSPRMSNSITPRPFFTPSTMPKSVFVPSPLSIPGTIPTKAPTTAPTALATTGPTSPQGQENGKAPLDAESTTSKGEVWEQFTPKGGIQILLSEPDAIASFEGVEIEFKNVGSGSIFPRQMLLQVYDSKNQGDGIFLKPEISDTKSDLVRFKLTGVQLAELVKKSSGASKFLFRLNSDSPIADKNNETKEINSIELKTFDELKQGKYTLFTSKYKFSKKGGVSLPLVIENERLGTTNMGVRIIAGSADSLKRVISAIVPGPDTSLQSGSIPTDLFRGSHFVEKNQLIFSVFPSNNSDADLERDWLTGGQDRMIFEGKMSDFIPPDQISDALRSIDSNRTIQFDSQIGFLKTKMANLQRWPGLAKRISDQSLPLIATNSSIKFSKDRSEDKFKPTPPASFVHPSALKKKGNLFAVLLDSKGTISFPTLEQLSFSTPTIFSTLGAKQIQKILSEKTVKIDASIKDTSVAKRLFSILSETVRLNLLLVAVEHNEGELHAEIIGKGYSGSILSRSFVSNRISQFQRRFFGSLDYDGQIVARNGEWVNIFSQNIRPVKGQWAAVYGRAQDDIWLPAIRRNEAPTAIVMCEIVKPQGCWARIFLTNEIVLEDGLVGSKTQWL